MLEPHTLHDISKLDIHAQIIGIELELIAIKKATILVYIHE